MISGSIFPQRLSRVDSLTLLDHSYLDAEDECYFLGEYTARKGFAFSATNHLVLNFKKSVSLRGQPQYGYKTAAIAEVGRAYAAALDTGWLDVATLVPVPPSKAPGDSLYDDRLTQMLRTIRSQPPLDVRELVVQMHSTRAAHELRARPSPSELGQLYRINPEVLRPAPRAIGIFDDVLTTGAHFKAVQAVLRHQFAGTRIVGFFIARRVPEALDPDEMDLLQT
jgi:hypothetical protein